MHAVRVSTGVVPCQSNSLPQPGNASTSELVPGLAVSFECQGGGMWLSGHNTTRVTQCIKGEWTQVLDICISEGW